MGGGKVQINLSDGVNVLSSEKINVGDSVKINFDGMKIEKVLGIKEKSAALVIKGKHMGKKGVIVKVEGEEVIVKTGEHDIKIREEELIVLD